MTHRHRHRSIERSSGIHITPMKTPFQLIANWKMNLDPTQEAARIGSLARVPSTLLRRRSLEVGLCPSYISLAHAARTLRGTAVQLGAQDCFWEPAGAYTGEISPAFLKKVGCRFVILGHSERRAYLGETDEMIARKILAARDAGLRVIVCVGETLQERKSGKTGAIIARQISSLSDVSRDYSGLAIAYEPVWAIGSGTPMTPADFSEMKKLIRASLSRNGKRKGAASEVPVLYGGSVQPGTVAGFCAEGSADGLLVGSASLRPKDLIQIIQAVSYARR